MCSSDLDTWRTETVAEMEMRCDRDWFFVTGKLVAKEDGAQVFERDWDERIPRRFV